jgi:hypothetical protein
VSPIRRGTLPQEEQEEEEKVVVMGKEADENTRALLGGLTEKIAG